MKATGACVLTSLLMVVLRSSAPAQWIIDQNADLVLGQKDFVSSAPGAGPDSLFAPTDVAIDPLTRKLFVADIANNRVLRWGRVDSLTSGQPAEAVFGQPDMESTGAATAANRMNFPTAIAIDKAGRLWVADALNNRVLRIDSAGFRPSGSPADGVLGQPNFTSNGSGLARDSMNYVRGIAVDDAGHLWVADQSNQRVLRFDDAASKPNGAKADGVLGQPDFTTFHDTLAQNSFLLPRGLTVDSHGRLYVADSYGCRVLRFDDAAAKPNGGNADGVLGEPDFDTLNPGVSQSSMAQPWGVEVDASGRLYVSEDAGSRVTWFDSAYAKPNGANADGVLGEPDFVTNTGGTAKNLLSSPWGACIDPVQNTLWVADASNNRVLRFTASSPLLSVAASVTRPTQYLLEQNYPNPFNPTTTIQYSIGGVVALSGAHFSGDFPERSRGVEGRAYTYVRLVVYDVLGREVGVLVNGVQPAGNYTVRFDGSALASGMYLYRLNAGSFTETRRMMLLK